MQPDAERGTLAELKNLAAAMEHDSTLILTYIQEAQWLIDQKKYHEADIEIQKALEVVRGLIK